MTSCLSDFPHELGSEFRDNIGKFLSPERIFLKETEYEILKENPKRIYNGRS